jgi:hypothetical protein
MTFSEWIVRQFTTFNVLLFVIIVLSNYITTTVSINRQLKEQKLFHEFEEVKEEINRLKEKE